MLTVILIVIIAFGLYEVRDELVKIKKILEEIRDKK